MTDECGKLQDSMLLETEPSEMANGHKAEEDMPSAITGDLKTEPQENGEEEPMEVNGGGGEEENVGTLQNGAHESCGEGQEKDEKELEANLGQNKKAKGKVPEGKSELMHTPAAMLTFTSEQCVKEFNSTLCVFVYK